MPPRTIKSEQFGVAAGFPHLAGHDSWPGRAPAAQHLEPAFPDIRCNIKVNLCWWPSFLTIFKDDVSTAWRDNSVAKDRARSGLEIGPWQGLWRLRRHETRDQAPTTRNVDGLPLLDAHQDLF
jgi:hypothetical protein